MLKYSFNYIFTNGYLSEFIPFISYNILSLTKQQSFVAISSLLGDCTIYLPKMHCGISLDHDPSSWHVRVALPSRLWLAAHSIVAVVPVGEAVQLPCVDPSTENAEHCGAELKDQGSILILKHGLSAMFEILPSYDYSSHICKRGHPEIGFTLRPARSMRVGASRITDTGFADDLALLANSVEELGVILRDVETVCKEVGLAINQNNTELLVENIPDPEPHTIKRADDFKYLGSWIRDSNKDIKNRKSKAWVACHGLKKNLELRFERRTKVPVVCSYCRNRPPIWLDIITPTCSRPPGRSRGGVISLPNS
eukprot:sb/3467104/